MSLLCPLVTYTPLSPFFLWHPSLLFPFAPFLQLVNSPLLFILDTYQILPKRGHTRCVPPTSSFNPQRADLIHLLCSLLTQQRQQIPTPHHPGQKKMKGKQPKKKKNPAQSRNPWVSAASQSTSFARQRMLALLFLLRVSQTPSSNPNPRLKKKSICRMSHVQPCKWTEPKTSNKPRLGTLIIKNTKPFVLREAFSSSTVYYCVLLRRSRLLRRRL